MNPSKSFMVLAIVCLVVAVYIFFVNLVVANDRLLANQQVLPTSYQNTTTSRNATELVETASLGASVSVVVHPRYGVLPIYSSVYGDLKGIHRFFIWIVYCGSLAGLVKANRIVLVWNKNRGASDLVYGLGWVVGVFVGGFLLCFAPTRLIHDLGYAFITYAIATFVFVGSLFLLRIYAYTHLRTWQKLMRFKEKVW